MKDEELLGHAISQHPPRLITSSVLSIFVPRLAAILFRLIALGNRKRGFRNGVRVGWFRGEKCRRGETPEERFQQRRSLYLL